MKKNSLFIVAAIIVGLSALAAVYHICVVAEHKAEIAAWQEAVEPIFTTQVGNVDTSTFTPDRVKHKLNPCSAASYLDRWRPTQRGCNSFAEPYAPVIVTSRFVDPEYETLIERHP